MENNENSFVKGVFLKMPNPNAPDFVLLEMSIKPQELFKWCQDHLTAESKGWVNVQIKRSKDGSKIYAQLNNWKPKAQESKKELTEQDKMNIESAKRVGGTLTDEDLESLAKMPF